MKIFDALRRENNEISALLPLVMEQEQAPEQAKVSAHSDTIAVRAVLGESDCTSPVSSAPKPAPPIVKPRGAIRQLPIRLPAGTPLLPFDNTNLVAAEQYRMIRTKLIHHPLKPQMVLVSSAGPGDGKSVTAINIAGALSLKSEGNVVLVDADFRRSTVHAQLGLPLGPGLTDVLSGRVLLEDALVQTQQFPNLYVLPAGERASNPSELLESPKWRDACERLRDRFRHSIVDSPPVASVADYELLQTACDGVVLVLRPDHTRRTAYLKALELIPKEKQIGLVMNCMPDWFLNPTDYGAYYSYHPTT